MSTDKVRKKLFFLFSKPLFWTALALFIIILFIGRIDLNQSVAQTAVWGEGTPHFLAKWVTATALPTPTITAGNTTIDYNTSTTISWSSSAATSCTVSPTGWTGTSGSHSTGNLTSSQTYTVNCSGPGGSASNSVTVTVTGAPSVNLTANGSTGTVTIPYNTSTTLSWSSANITSCTASGDWHGSKPTSGSESTGNLTSSKTYTLTCSGPGASASATVVVSVPAPDFNLNLSNDIYATLVLNQPGDSNTSTLTITAFNGFDSTVNLSVASVSPALPSATTYHFSPSNLNKNKYSSGSQFYVSIGAGLSSSRVYTITLQAADGGLVRTANVLLNVQMRNPDWEEL